MDPTYTLKPQLRIKITNIYLDETVTLIQYIKLTSALLCYDDVIQTTRANMHDSIDNSNVK